MQQRLDVGNWAGAADTAFLLLVQQLLNIRNRTGAAAIYIANRAGALDTA